jgi:hypothetical protein
MQLPITDLRIILDALNVRLGHFQAEQDQLADTQQDRIAELSNDIYALEFLRDCLLDELTKRVKQPDE